MSSRILQATERAALDQLRRGVPQRGIAKKLGLSKTSVARLAEQLKLARRSSRAVQLPKSVVQTAREPDEDIEHGDEPDDYVEDPDAVDSYVAELAEWMDRRVDRAVAAELVDPVATAQRLERLAATAGWLTCATCGQHMPPDGGKD